MIIGDWLFFMNMIYDFFLNDSGTAIVMTLLLTTLVVIIPIYFYIRRRVLRKRLIDRAKKASRKTYENRLALDRNRKSHHWENDH